MLGDSSSGGPFTPRHSQNRIFDALRCLRSSFLLISWRSLRTFMQADFHASMKSAHKNVRVNWVEKMEWTKKA